MRGKNLEKCWQQMYTRPDETREYQKYELHIFWLNPDSREDNDLQRLNSLLNSLAFEFDEITPSDQTKKKLETTDLLIIATYKLQPVGVAAYQLIEGEDKKIIYQSRAVVPQHCNSGLGKQFSNISCSLFKPDVIAARAQNPISIWATIKSGILEETFPIEKMYGQSEEMKKILRYLIAKRGFCLEEVDLDSGLQKEAYKMGKLGCYQINKNHAGVMMVENRLYEIGLNRERGDAVYYMGKVKI